MSQIRAGQHPGLQDKMQWTISRSWGWGGGRGLGRQERVLSKRRDSAIQEDPWTFMRLPYCTQPSPPPIPNFLLHCATCGILVPWPVIQPSSQAVEAQSLNHWTTRNQSFKSQIIHLAFGTTTVCVILNWVFCYWVKLNRTRKELLLFLLHHHLCWTFPLKGIVSL